MVNPYLDSTYVVETSDGSLTLMNQELGEAFHSKGGACYEAKSLYLSASGLAEKMAGDSNSDLAILDVGLGLGYNICCAIEAWLAGPGSNGVIVSSLECDVALFEALNTGRAPWQLNWPDTWKVWVKALEAVPGASKVFKTVLVHPTSANTLSWSVYLGDALETVETVSEKAWNYVWQDPFSPQKAPSLWSQDWFQTIKKYSKNDVVLVTYSVAGAVKSALKKAGWSIEKVSTGGPKKHWLKAKQCEISTT